ncbi:MAG: lipopolysaccharide biosynthesis protein [Bacteroidota bacterium]
MLSIVKNSPFKIKDFFRAGSERSGNIKKNIVLSFAFKCGNILISLLFVPLTIDFVSPKQYGIWLTLSSLVAWLSFFDIGFGNGLRNKFAEAVALNKVKLARIYVSTTYAILSVIIGLVLILFLTINPFLNWTVILNAPGDSASALSRLALLVFLFFCLQFVLQLITTIATANQQPAKSSAINFYGNLLSFVIIYILTKTTQGNLMLLGLISNGVTVIVLIVASLILFRGEYKKYAPSFNFIRLRYARNLTSMGIKFFIVQIAAVILFQCDNIIIAQLFGPEEVIPYNIVYRYFGVVTMVASIIMTPFWSAFTDAWHKKDIAWIKTSIGKLQKLWLLSTVMTAVFLLISQFAFRVWLGDRIQVSFALSFFMAINVLVITWNMIFVQFLNGIGKIKLQLYSGIIGTLLTIPLTYIMACRFQLVGVVIASCALGLTNTCWTYLQYKKIVENKATGIWNK